MYVSMVSHFKWWVIFTIDMKEFLRMWSITLPCSLLPITVRSPRHLSESSGETHKYCRLPIGRTSSQSTQHLLPESWDDLPPFCLLACEVEFGPRLRKTSTNPRLAPPIDHSSTHAPSPCLHKFRNLKFNFYSHWKIFRQRIVTIERILIEVLVYTVVFSF